MAENGGTTQDFEGISSRLDEIIETVRSKDTSLERSLDLFDEAIALGSKAVEMVDKLEFSDAERARLEGENKASQPDQEDETSSVVES